MKLTATPKPGRTNSLPSSDSFTLFGDADFSGLVAFLEDEVDRFMNVAGVMPDKAPQRIWNANRFLEALIPLLKSLSKGGCNADQLFPVLELAVEAVARPLMSSPKSRALALRYQRLLDVQRKQRDRGGLNKGTSKLAPYDEQIKELFEEFHGGGVKPRIHRWRKEMLGKLELKGIAADPDRLTDRLKTLKLLPDRKR